MKHEEQEMPARRRVTMQEIAERCGVNQMTVSRVMRNEKYVSEENRARILQVATELGYDPLMNQAARRLRAQRSSETPALNHTIALVFPQLFYTMKYFQTLFIGMLDVASNAMFEVVTTYSDFVTATSFSSGIVRGDVDGVILTNDRGGENSLIPWLRKQTYFENRPIVDLLEIAQDCSCVLPDDVGAARAATAHLLELGHRRIAHYWLTAPWEQGQMARRYEGCRQACEAYGIDPKQCLVTARKQKVHGPEEDSYIPPLLAVLASNPDITAIMAINDLHTSVIRDMLAERGMRVPEDMSIVGFDDTDPMLDTAGNNVLTTVRLPLDALGRTAMTLLIDQVLGKAVSNQQMVLPTELIVRRSTMPPRC
jgi:LacI family transcriptional regulator/LacI family repressor for deo operon, udp, cdd, tsx, nupC, and nupG